MYAVICHFQEFLDLPNVFVSFFVTVCFFHAFEDVFFGGFGQVNHVAVVKAVVAQFIHHDFVAGEVLYGRFRCVRCKVLLFDDFVYSELQRRFRKRVRMRAVAQVP